MFNAEVNGREYSLFQVKEAYVYKNILFPDSLTDNPGCNLFLAWLLTARLKIDHDNFVYFRADSTIKNKEVPLNKIASTTGGQKEFFKPGAKILDIGSGAGIAVSQLSNFYPETTIVGLELLYKSKPPAYPEHGLFVGGDWNKLPFKDNEFTGIFSLETFPTYAEWIWDYEKTFEEFTRISKPGAVWRGTLKDGSVKGDPASMALVSYMTGNGWDVFINNHKFVAKLVNKK